MTNRIVLLDANPGRVRTVVENALPRPRDYRSPGLLALVDHLHDAITGMEMPDASPEPVSGVTFEPIPQVNVGEILGLLEYLDARGGREDVFRIASDNNREFGKLIAVVNAAELLDLVETPKRLVVLSEAGARLVKASPSERKALWRDRILQLRFFRYVKDTLARPDEQRVDRDFILELIAIHMPNEDYDAVFDTFVNWSRFADLFSYDDVSQTVRMCTPP
jgi:NitT/TauT family transport system ATP-binding protein